MPEAPRRTPPPGRSAAGLPAPRAATPAAVRQLAAQAAAPAAALRRRAEALIAAIERQKGTIGAGFYEIGRSLAQLLDEKLHVPLGYPSFAALVEERKLMSRAFAWQLIAIYRAIPKETVQRLGPQKAFEWLRLLRAEAGPDAGDEEVQQRATGEPLVAGRPVAELTVTQLAELRRRFQARQAAARRDPGAAEARRTARALAQYLQRIGAEQAEVASRYAHGAWEIRVVLDVPSAQVVCGRKP
jgi:hypothetical protein